MDTSPMHATTGRSGAASCSPTAVGRSNTNSPPAADKWENGWPAWMHSSMTSSLLPASVTQRVSFGARRPNVDHRAAGDKGALAAATGYAGSGLGAGALRVDFFT